jgi:hypothetical protein
MASTPHTTSTTSDAHTGEFGLVYLCEAERQVLWLKHSWQALSRIFQNALILATRLKKEDTNKSACSSLEHPAKQFVSARRTPLACSKVALRVAAARQTHLDAHTLRLLAPNPRLLLRIRHRRRPPRSWTLPLLRVLRACSKIASPSSVPDCLPFLRACGEMPCLLSSILWQRGNCCPVACMLLVPRGPACRLAHHNWLFKQALYGCMGVGA